MVPTLRHHFENDVLTLQVSNSMKLLHILGQHHLSFTHLVHQRLAHLVRWQILGKKGLHWRNAHAGNVRRHRRLRLVDLGIGQIIGSGLNRREERFPRHPTVLACRFPEEAPPPTEAECVPWCRQDLP